MRSIPGDFAHDNAVCPMPSQPPAKTLPCEGSAMSVVSGSMVNRVLMADSKSPAIATSAPSLQPPQLGHPTSTARRSIQSPQLLSQPQTCNPRNWGMQQAQQEGQHLCCRICRPGLRVAGLTLFGYGDAGPVDATEDGQRIRVDVGPISRRSPRTFVFDRCPHSPDPLGLPIP